MYAWGVCVTSPKRVIRSEIFPASRNATSYIWWCKGFLFPAGRFPRLLVTQDGRTSFWTNHLCAITFQRYAFRNNNDTSCHNPRKLTSYAHAAMKNRIRELVKLDGSAGICSPLLYDDQYLCAAFILHSWSPTNISAGTQNVCSFIDGGSWFNQTPRALCCSNYNDFS